MLKKKREPEEELAIAVLQRLVADLQSRSRVRRREARADLAAGGVLYWVEMLCDYEWTVDSIKAELWRLAA
jgi:hypothetical protein